ncbi:MAG: DNA-binding response regulator [Vampirovibrio sp.]|jgi:two-component system response regulator RpaA|nr:DNA-binding response regulator [Vampirovibrio sp.]
MAKIIVVDDDPAIQALIKINLELQRHQVLTASDGVEGYALIQQEIPDLVILDVMMPNADGYTVCQRIRKNPATEHIPVLMLTALGVMEDKVKGFDVGADDYLVKPFELPELQVRVRALLRRSGQLPKSAATQDILSIGDITLIPENLEVKVHNRIVKLTPTEFEIMNCLVQNHHQAISLGKLLQDVWGYSPNDDVETIRVHVRHLRSKLEKVSEGKSYIETIYGGGYRLIPEGLAKKA